MALSALTTASKVYICCSLCLDLRIYGQLILSQVNLDASIRDLITRVKQTYELILENMSPSKINAKRDVIVEIAQDIQECAQFIAKYSETRNFCMLIGCIGHDGLTFLIGRRLGKSVFSETATKVANYNSKLDKLMQELRDQALVDVQCNVQQIREDLSLDSLACAGRVGLNKEKKCLDGTRTEILKEVVDWINNTDATTPRILWLHGQAGKGKSAIAHMIALQAENLGLLGSCFCFTRVRQHEGLHMKLFPTVARDLADRDLRLRPLLAEVITNRHSLRDMEDIGEQWQKFIFEPLFQLERSLTTGNAVVVIDALDESGTKRTRSTILKVLAGHDAKLPVNLRILLTSRPLADIREVLEVTQHVRVRSLDDIDTELTIGDIRLYVSERLKKLGDTFSRENLQQLAVKSGGVFEWARLACDFISHQFRTIARKRLTLILSHAPGDGRTLLDEMYTTFLKELTKGQSDVLDMFRSVMRQILWLKEPLSICALDFIRDRFPHKDDHYPVGDVLNSMASLLSGTSNVFTPVRPLHASFYDFLLDERRSREFFIQESNVHHDLTMALLSIMEAGLKFNICRLETSYLPNSKVVDLEKRIKKNIPPYLLYACQFWAIHLQDGGFDVELAQSVSGLVTGEKFLFWLEVLGICRLIREADQALSYAERWFQVRSLS